MWGVEVELGSRTLLRREHCAHLPDRCSRSGTIERKESVSLGFGHAASWEEDVRRPYGRSISPPPLWCLGGFALRCYRQQSYMKEKRMESVRKGDMLWTATSTRTPMQSQI